MFQRCSKNQKRKEEGWGWGVFLQKMICERFQRDVTNHDGAAENSGRFAASL